MRLRGSCFAVLCAVALAGCADSGHGVVALEVVRTPSGRVVRLDHPMAEGWDRSQSLDLSQPLSVAIIGDSLTLSAIGELRTVMADLQFAEVTIDAVQSRRMVDRSGTVTSGAESIASILETHPPDLWVIALGTNDVSAAQSADTVRDAMESVLALIPVAVPVIWVDIWIRDQALAVINANKIFRSVMAARPGTAVVDWSSYGSDPSIFANDGIHITEGGQVLFAAAIASAIAGFLER